MRTTLQTVTPFLAVVALQQSLLAAPQADLEPQRLVVTARDYRVTFHRWQCDLQIELRDGQGHWRTVTRRNTQPEFALVDARGVHSSIDAPARLRHARVGDAIVIGITTVLPSTPPTVARIHFLCMDDGMLVRFVSDSHTGGEGACWALPRLALDETLFDGYAYWRADDQLRSGQIAALGAPTAFAGVSPWGNQGDTASRLSTYHPAILARSRSAGACPRGSLSGLSGPLDPFTLVSPAVRLPSTSTSIRRSLIAKWLARAAGLGSPHCPPIPRPPRPQSNGSWTPAKSSSQDSSRLPRNPRSIGLSPVPDFPAALRRARPVQDIRQAVVYTINETILSDDGIDLARKTGSDVLIRGWFKWGTAPDFAKLAPVVHKAHAMGALFGGGITCSALYHGESGLTEKQVLDMATRGPAGQLIDAWGEPNCRHGTLSNPAYLEYLLSSCKRQIDAGADVLFMDEINAALQADEGFDDYSVADFRKFLLDRYGKQGWTPDRRPMAERLQDRSGRSAHRARRDDADVPLPGVSEVAWTVATTPHAAANPLAADWHVFRDDRDDRAWKWLTDAIRAYAAAKGRHVLINGNGLARYVDLQVLGVWENWRTKDGRIDLSESQIDQWGSTVAAGWGMAGRKVPVVLFHDWGFGGFPWMEVPPEDRRLWIRVRGAEIYAAGGFFAFPVHGPSGNDARQDGTLAEIARQSQFYHEHQDLYLDAELLGFEPLETSEPGSAWPCGDVTRRRASSFT